MHDAQAATEGLNSARLRQFVNEHEHLQRHRKHIKTSANPNAPPTTMPRQAIHSPSASISPKPLRVFVANTMRHDVIRYILALLVL